MKFRILVLFLFLNVFCKLASAQWNDEVFLLQDPENHHPPSKIKKNRNSPNNTIERKKELSRPHEADKGEEARKPSQEDVNEQLTAKDPDPKDFNYVDVLFGFRKMDQVSKFSFKDFYGETPTIGVKAGIDSGLWSWYLLYDTGFYYQVAKHNELRLRDEMLQVGFFKKIKGEFENLYFGMAYFENQIINENQNTDFVGNKKNGLTFSIEKLIALDESMTITPSVSITPWINYSEIITQKEIKTGSSPSGIAELLRLVVSEKLNDNTHVLFQGHFNWTQVQFKGTTSVVDPKDGVYHDHVRVNDESYSFQIGFRWFN